MTHAHAPMAGVILAGGRASRMGGPDKAFAAVAGEPIVVRTVRVFRTVVVQKDGGWRMRGVKKSS